MALPLLFVGLLPCAAGAAVGAFNTGRSPAMEAGVQAGWTTFSFSQDQLGGAAAALGFPAPTGLFQLWGGGAVISKPQLRISVLAATGSLAAEAAGRSTAFGLDLAGVLTEQRYPLGGWEATGGAIAFLGSHHQELRDRITGDYARFDARFPGYGASAGLRWPDSSRLSFYARGGYVWMQANGDWKGSLVPARNSVDLSAPWAQAGMDLHF